MQNRSNDSPAVLSLILPSGESDCSGRCARSRQCDHSVRSVKKSSCVIDTQFGGRVATRSCVTVL